MLSLSELSVIKKEACFLSSLIKSSPVDLLYTLDPKAVLMDIVIETAILFLSTMLTWLVPLSSPKVVFACHIPPYFSVDSVTLLLNSSLQRESSQEVDSLRHAVTHHSMQ